MALHVVYTTSKIALKCLVLSSPSKQEESEMERNRNDK